MTRHGGVRLAALTAMGDQSGIGAAGVGACLPGEKAESATGDDGS
jgi:hypothetical protein